jgi:nicotinate-nucleotide adenylyltransferase
MAPPEPVAGVGIYGGTFNPVHVGHLRAAEEVREALGLSRVIFVPSGRPPHKRAHDHDPIAPGEDRLAWVEAAVATNPHFDVDALELEREGPSYLVDTLEALASRFDGQRLVFVLGCDAFQEMGGWREPARLLTQADFAVTTRPPLRTGSLPDWLPEGLGDPLEIGPDGLSAVHRDAGTRIQLIEISALDVSASSIRQRIREGRSVRYLLPETIHDRVVDSGAYATAAPSHDETSSSHDNPHEGPASDRSAGPAHHGAPK